eukprot:GAFH01001825.1.p1 GENE.GAFH01001825.1~~GAFH01001825.1.p1  ORF type:complete len:425 (+),score=68.19 GAFH01001825.1:90-1277(+)
MDPNLPCAQEGCELQNDNWLCLKCHNQFCGRSGNGHMKEHFQHNNEHCLCVSYKHNACWCYVCNAYIRHPLLAVVHGAIQAATGSRPPKDALMTAQPTSTAPAPDDVRDEADRTLDKSRTGFIPDMKFDCPHVHDEHMFNSHELAVNIQAPCACCGDATENWLCLSCHQVMCSRYVKGHMKKHCIDERHCLALSFSDLSVWCYQCDSYISDPTLRPLLAAANRAKFTQQSAVAAPTGPAAAEVAATSTSTGPTAATAAAASAATSAGPAPGADDVRDEEDRRLDRSQTGFQADIKYDCPHCEDEAMLSQADLHLDIQAPCALCHDRTENWLCLGCHQVMCSRYVKGHMKKHCIDERHCLALSFSDLSVWCYQCESYVAHPRLRPFLKALEMAKFG